MIFDWYKVINHDDFIDSGLVSKEVSGVLTGLGLKDILVTKGETTGILFDGVFMSLNLNSENPFIFEDRAAYIDANQDIWVGVKVED